MTPRNQRSELSSATMIPQMTVVADLTRSEDWLSLKPGDAVGDCHARRPSCQSSTKISRSAGTAPPSQATVRHPMTCVAMAPLSGGQACHPRPPQGRGWYLGGWGVIMALPGEMVAKGPGLRLPRIIPCAQFILSTKSVKIGSKYFQQDINFAPRMHFGH
jgi:hypothetical protein